MNLHYLYLFFNPIIPGAPRSPRSFDTRLSLSYIFSLLSLRPWGARNSRHSWYAIQPRNPRKVNSRAKMDIWKEKKYWLGGKKKQQQKKTVSALFTISPFSPLDPCSPFTPLIHGDPLLPHDPSWPLSPFIPIIPVEPFNVVMRLSGLTIKAFNSAKCHLISFFSSCSRHPSRYLDTRLFLSSLENTQVVDIVREITRKINYSDFIKASYPSLQMFWPSFIKIRKRYIHY